MSAVQRGSYHAALLSVFLRPSGTCVLVFGFFKEEIKISSLKQLFKSMNFLSILDKCHV